MTVIFTAGRADSSGPWQWPVDAARYDTEPLLRAAEQDAIAELGPGNLRRLARHDPAAPGWQQIRRLLGPLDDATNVLAGPLTSHRRRAMLDATAVALLRCAETGRSYWSWTDEEWAGLLGQDQDGFRKAAPGWADDAVRPYLAAHAFLLDSFTAFYRLGSFSRLTLAWRVFGRDRVDSEIGRIRSVLAGWGYRLGRDDDQLLPMVACQMLLLNRSPHLEDLSTELFERARRERLLPAARGNTLHAMQRAVAELGFCDPPQRLTGRHSVRASGGPPAWKAQVERWHGTSALSPTVRDSFRATLLKAGRWLEAEQTDAADPASWTRQTCAAWVAAVDRMKVGDYAQRTAGLKDQLGKPLEAATKAGQLAALRTFFRDLQEWEQIPRRFDPQRALAVPRSIAALLAPDPRVIADDIWATPAISRRPSPGTSTRWNWSARSRWPGCSPASAATRSPASGSAASAGSTTAPRSPATLTRCWPATRSACWTCPRTRPAPRSPSPSTRSWARPSTPGKPSARPSRSSPTAAPASRLTCCSPSGPGRSPPPTSTTRSSRCSAARPAFPPPTSAATSPATGPAPRSPPSSTTPRSR